MSQKHPVSESISGVAGPAMHQAAYEFSSRRLDAPASLGRPLFNAYILAEQRREDASRQSYRVGGPRGSHGARAAEDFHTEEHFGDWDIR